VKLYRAWAIIHNDFPLPWTISTTAEGAMTVFGESQGSDVDEWPWEEVETTFGVSLCEVEIKEVSNGPK
jgi:hypothetical protein